MSEGGTTGTSSRLAKGIGGLTMVLGSVLIVMAFFPMKRFFAGEKEWMDCLVTLVVVTLMVVPGCLVVLGGYQFLREVNLPNLKVLAGVYSAIGAIWLSARLVDWIPEMGRQRIAFGFLNLGTAVFAIWIYLLVLRWLIPALGLRWSGFRSVLGKGAFILLAWLLWMALSAVGHELSRRNLDDHLGFIPFFVPILLAWVFYKIAVKWLEGGATNP